MAHHQPDLLGIGPVTFAVGVGDGDAGRLGGRMDIEKGIKGFLSAGMPHHLHAIKCLREKRKGN